MLPRPLKTILTPILCLTILHSAAVFTPAFAEKGGKNKEYKKDRSVEKRYDHDHHDDDTVTLRIGGTDRDTILRLLRDENSRHCPPGLAKKNNGCLPPGQAKKYVIGQPLRDDVYALPLPGGWSLRAPDGYRYVRVDKDVLLISEATKKVIDAVTLLSAIGN